MIHRYSTVAGRIDHLLVQRRWQNLRNPSDAQLEPELHASCRRHRAAPLRAKTLTASAPPDDPIGAQQRRARAELTPISASRIHSFCLLSTLKLFHFTDMTKSNRPIMRIPGFTTEASLYRKSDNYRLETLSGRDEVRSRVSPSGDDDCCWWVWSFFFWWKCCANARIAGRYDKCCPRA